MDAKTDENPKWIAGMSVFKNGKDGLKNVIWKFSLFIGADNLFNMHPDLGVNPQAKGYAEDNESGGPWDSVQMGFNGRRLFTKIAFNF